MRDIELRNLQQKDLNYMLEWMNDQDITRNFQVDFSSKQIEDLAYFIENSQSNTYKHFAIIDKNDNYLGTISLKNISLKNKNAEYAIVLRKNYIGKGVAKDATNIILSKAFEEYGLNKVYLNVLEDNQRAIKFYENVGFKYEGIARDHFVRNGEFYSLKWYSILKKEFYTRGL